MSRREPEAGGCTGGAGRGRAALAPALLHSLAVLRPGLLGVRDVFQPQSSFWELRPASVDSPLVCNT